jgi:hypothetical protein
MKMNNKWIDRKFDFGFDASIYPEFIDRLRATPTNLESLLSPIPRTLLKVKNKDEWSIQENVGHLISADDLFTGRLDDYESGMTSLRPADISGAKTDKENYNSKDIENLLSIFEEKRLGYIHRLEKIDPYLFGESSWHPRLEKQMRLCDMLYFQAEHDDHHLKKIKTLQQRFH